MASETCPVCRASCGQPGRVRRGVPIYSCKHCEADFAPIPAVDVIESKDSFIEGIQVGFAKQVDLARSALPLRVARYERILGRKVARVLEIGCATGAYAIPFRELGIAYIGLEIEEEMARSARSRTGCDIRPGNFLETSLEGPFDVIFLSQVLEHVPDPASFLAKCRELVPHGLIHLDVPNQNSMTAIVRKYLHPTDFGFIQPNYHLIAFKSATMRFLAGKIGMDLKMLGGLANDNKAWGQLIAPGSLANWLLYRVSEAFGLGSLLTAIFIPIRK